MEIQSRRLFFFFCLTLWNPNIKAMNINNLVHGILNPWFGYFQYFGNRLHDITINWLFSINVSIWLLSIINWSTQSWSIIQWEISSMKLCKPLLTCLISHSMVSIHCTNIFLHCGCAFTFPEIIMHDMPKMLLFSSIFNIKMATHKFTSFDKFLKMYADMSCHNTI